jgi:iron complex outermembrane receptor protein
MQGVEGRGQASISERAITNQILTHTLNFDEKLGSDLSLNAVVGYEYQKRTEKGSSVTAKDFIVGDFDYTNILQNSTNASRNISSYSPPDQELQSFLARANLNFQDKYLLTASFRADGSSKFGENNRYGYFPAFALAWNLHNEGFLADGPFDNLKLRLGWGKTGNSEFAAGASQERWGFGQQSIALENVANPDLKWETTTNINAGIDFALFDYKLSGSLEYFNRISEDLLFTFPAIPPAPATDYWINLDGQVANSGFEAALNAQVVETENLKWDIGFNATFIKNELKDYTGPNIPYGELFGQGSTGAISMRLESGQPLNSFYLAKFEKIGEDGQSVYANDGEKEFVGDPNPDVLLGISTGLSFGNFSLGLNFNGAFGHEIFNNTKMSVIPIGNLGTRNIDASLLDGNVQEATSNPIAASSRYLEKGDYLKLANATLGYNVGNIGNAVKNVRVFISGTNLLLFTGYKGFDPEVNTENVFNNLPSFGIEYIPYPSARTFVLGANFSF